MKKILSLVWRFLPAWGRFIFVPLIFMLFVFQGHALLVQKEGDSPLPPLFGNFKKIRETLTDAPGKDEFGFAVVGDTKSVGVFERICEELRKTEIDFAVLLGDCSSTGTESAHRYFRAECAEEYALGCPVFYVVGNHDVDPNHFPVSRFEELYGPSIFSFEYQDCLFIVLRVMGDPVSDRASLDFLKSFLTQGTARYRRRFVFMHIPPPVPSFDAQKSGAPGELIPLFRQLNASYVFAGHYHGYARTEYNDTTYIVSGGGGARLDHGKLKQFHHAMVIRVGKDYVSEQIVPVPRSHDLEDRIERLAITEVYPWLSENRVAACILNAGLLVVFIGIVKPFYKRRSKKKHVK
jgi:Predicted phosphohydrolases